MTKVEIYSPRDIKIAVIEFTGDNWAEVNKFLTTAKCQAAQLVTENGKHALKVKGQVAQIGDYICARFEGDCFVLTETELLNLYTPTYQFAPGLSERVS